MTKAIIYIPANQVGYCPMLTQYCESHRYDLGGIVHNNLAAAMRMVSDDEAATLLVAREEHLTQERHPRIEVVASQPTIRGERRTRIIRRNAAK